MPITRPRASARGPPELPGAMRTSAWIQRARDPEAKDKLRAAAAAAHRPAEIEVYPAEHGWTVADTPMYDAAAAETAWGRMKALFATLSGA